jgi:hypothetical protein
MAVRLSALCASCALTPKKDFLVLISVRGWVNPSAMEQLVGLGKLEKKKNPMTSLGTEPAAFRLVA